MEHLALYRKWRPQNFSALVGQNEIANILKRAILTKRQGHAYLFCGTRGTGKTSTARILAKALNCHHPVEGEPCNACSSCLSITQGHSLDVIEIDAASNRGIDEVRDLLEKIHFVPAESTYKVYIIDEAHMLTTEAFNALLKTFEEPPSHVIFILATTEPRKVPLTILSRCQRYDFKPIGEKDLAEALKVIGIAEGFSMEEEALAFLAQRGKGSMRDALSLMDQGMTTEEKTLTVAGLSAMLGSVLTEFLAPFIEKLANNDGPGVFYAMDTLIEEGKDLRGFVQDLQQFLGDLLSFSGDASQSYGKALTQAKDLFSVNEIIAMLTILGENEGAFRYHKDSKIVARFLMAKILYALHQRETTSVPVKSESKVKAISTKKESAAPLVSEKPIPEKEENAKAVPIMKEEAKKETSKEENLEEVWSQVLGEVRKASQKTFTWLSRGHLKSFQYDVLTVEYYESDGMYQGRVELPEHQEVILKVLEDIFGRKIQLKITSESNTILQEGSLFES